MADRVERLKLSERLLFNKPACSIGLLLAERRPHRSIVLDSSLACGKRGLSPVSRSNGAAQFFGGLALAGSFILPLDQRFMADLVESLKRSERLPFNKPTFNIGFWLAERCLERSNVFDYSLAYGKRGLSLVSLPTASIGVRRRIELVERKRKWWHPANKAFD